jgi:hypothetical protein
MNGNDWEDILNAYLEGKGLRADAEDLRFRLHLSAEEREQIERALRVADQIDAALKPIQPPAEFGARVTTALRGCPAPASLPQSWQASGSGFISDRPARSDQDDLVDAAIEGLASTAELQDFSDDDARQAVEHLASTELLMTQIPSPPAGLETRLRDRLRAHMSAQSDPIDERTLHRLLNVRPQRRTPPMIMPDVLAAEEKPEDDDDK